MNEVEFEYGPVSKGIYIALIALTPLIPVAFPRFSVSYIVFIVFLGFGLRPLLHFSGAYAMWNSCRVYALEKWDRKFLQRHRAKIDRKVRDDAYRKSRVRDPRLPKRW